jgi:hypothetical protein
MTDSQLPNQDHIQSLQAHLDLICALLGEIERAQMLSSDPTEN